MRRFTPDRGRVGKAARWDGRTSRRYPWGDTFDGTRLNTAADTSVPLTPVGRYPSGATPYGVQDIGGTVYQWTSSLWMRYPYCHDDGREDPASTDRRVMRGTPPGNGARCARATSRTQDVPGAIGRAGGFRRALSPAGS